MKKDLRIFMIVFWLSILSFQQANCQVPEIKWHYDVNAPAFGQAASADIDNDGKPEIVFSTYMNDGEIYALNAENGSLLWHYKTGNCNDAGPVIYDVDMDGNPEVILASSCLTWTYCFDGATGGVKWQTPTGGTDSPPSIGDVDNDGKPEILHGEFNGSVICINGEDGSISWEKEIDGNASIQTSASILDVDGNGQLDFVVANWSYASSNHIWAFRGDNRQQLWQSDLPTDVIYHGGSFADLDGDGKPELAFGCYDYNVYLLNAEDGSEKWHFYMGNYNYVGGPVVLGDVNNDDHYELLAAGWYKMKAIRSTGTELWNYNIPGYASCFRGTALSDIDGDNILELVFGTSEGKVIALEGESGVKKWILDLAAEYGDTLDIDHAPVIGDFDGDGKLEGFVVGGFTDYPNISNDYGRAYCFSLGDGTTPPWPMFQHDVERSSCLKPDWHVGIPAQANTREIIVNAAPNPFHDNLRIRVSLSHPGPVRMDLCDLSGRFIQQLVNNNIHSGDFVYEISFLPGEPAPGTYLLKVSSGKLTKTIKVFKIED
ncbi:MAG: FG-GAP-like repeat-containing protein [Bacteroidetes bacterium]|nr:FG-GAP-like repeat-containing protein [Bacteroidota bacterium]